MRILYFGTSPFALPALRALLTQRVPVVGVVTQPDRPAGRGGRLTPPPVKVCAQEWGVPLLQPESCRAPEFIEEIRALAPDLIVVAAYGQFLPDPVLTLPPCGSVNLHGSLLPRYRGAAPIQRALWQGETVTGVCLMWMVRAMDAGDVIACTDLPILAADTAGTLTEKLADAAAALLLAWLPALATGTAPRHAQCADAVTFAPAIRKEERAIVWQDSAEAIWRQVRALTPSPGAQAWFQGTPVKIITVRPHAPSRDSFRPPEGTPGLFVECDPKAGLKVLTGDGILGIISLQPAGKRPMSGQEFVRGYRVSCGDRFSSPESECA